MNCQSIFSRHHYNYFMNESFIVLVFVSSIQFLKIAVDQFSSGVQQLRIM